MRSDIFCIPCNAFVEEFAHACKGKDMEPLDMEAPFLHSHAVPTRFGPQRDGTC